MGEIGKGLRIYTPGAGEINWSARKMPGNARKVRGLFLIHYAHSLCRAGGIVGATGITLEELIPVEETIVTMALFIVQRTQIAGRQQYARVCGRDKHDRVGKTRVEFSVGYLHPWRQRLNQDIGGQATNLLHPIIALRYWVRITENPADQCLE